MVALITVSSLVLYVIIGLLVYSFKYASLANRENDHYMDREDAVMSGVGWPVVIVFYLILVPIVSHFEKFAVKTLQKRVER